MTDLAPLARCAECGCLSPAHYGSCSQVDIEMRQMLDSMSKDAEARRAANKRTEAEQANRRSRFNMMRANTDTDAPDMTVFALPLRSMNPDEIRIAAYWMASRLKDDRYRDA